LCDRNNAQYAYAVQLDEDGDVPMSPLDLDREVNLDDDELASGEERKGDAAVKGDKGASSSSSSDIQLDH